MAKVTGPLHSSEARGRVGGLVYNTYRGISTVKASSAPTQPRTSLQLRIRAIGVKLARLWQGLTTLNRTSWTTYATNHPETDSMGSPKRLTGLNMFTRLNSRLLQMNITTLTSAPSIAAPAPVLNFTAANGVGSSVLTFTSFGQGAQLWLHKSGPHSAGRQGSLLRASYATVVTATTGTFTLTGLTPGSWDLYARSVDILNGQASPWVSAPVVVT